MFFGGIEETRDIGWDREDVCSSLKNSFLNSSKIIMISAIENNVGPLAGICKGNGLTDALAGSRNQGHFTF